MKKYITTAFTKISVFVFMLFTSLVCAQTDLPEAPVDEPAPIDDYVWLLAAIGLIFVFMKFRAMQKKIKSSI